MRENILPFSANVKTQITATDILHRRKRIWTAVTVASTLVGFLLAAIGIILSFLACLENDDYRLTNSRYGGFLLLASFPIFILAAHALDKIASIKRAAKLETMHNKNLLVSAFRK